jgi:putative membrane protein
MRLSSILNTALKGAALATLSGTVFIHAANAQTAADSATSAASATSQPNPAKVSKKDQEYMQTLATANMTEIAVAKLAQTQSQNDSVHTFAQKMIDDHTQALNDLTQLAQTKGVTLPSAPEAKQEAEVKKLEALSGAKFDRAYKTQAGSADHHKAHQLLSRISQSASDPDLKALAAKMLPTVEQHMKMVKQIQAG